MLFWIKLCPFDLCIVWYHDSQTKGVEFAAWQPNAVFIKISKWVDPFGAWWRHGLLFIITLASCWFQHIVLIVSSAEYGASALMVLRWAFIPDMDVCHGFHNVKVDATGQLKTCLYLSCVVRIAYLEKQIGLQSPVTPTILTWLTPLCLLHPCQLPMPLREMPQ